MHDDLRWFRFAFHWTLGSLLLYVALALGTAHAAGAITFGSLLRALIGALLGGSAVAVVALLLRRRKREDPADLPGALGSATAADGDADTLRRQLLWGAVWALTSLMFFASCTLSPAYQHGSVLFERVSSRLWIDVVMGAFAGFIGFVAARHRRRPRSRSTSDDRT